MPDVGNQQAAQNGLQISYVSRSRLTPYPGNARTHSRKQRKAIAASIKRFGFINPIIINEQYQIIAGHGRWMAADDLAMENVPVVMLSSMSEADRRAYVIADNRLAEQAGWDPTILAIELQALVELNFDDIELTGFSRGQIDEILSDATDRLLDGPGPEDATPEISSNTVCRRGELWQLGSHRLLCGDAREPQHYGLLLGEEPAQLVLTDPPYNVAIQGNVSGLGRARHEEFAMASGEMSESEFTAFLSGFLANAKANLVDGGLLYVFMDWRHLHEIIVASKQNDLALKNVVVWAKDNAGMGSFYRSKHEHCLILKKGDAPHINTFELGQHGRYRTNVWEYAGVNTFRKGRAEDLAMHPTVKPVAMLADAIKDVSERKAIVLDPFGGSGSVLIAAEKTGRRARLIEYEPHYCDVILRRWQTFTGKAAVLDGRTFEEIEAERQGGAHV